jgi:periplasmic mercuric ion binding protein
MKSLNLFLTLLLMAVFSMSAVAQTGNQTQVKKSPAMTESFKVWGKCEMCKARIESTVKGEGATNASWDQKTQMLTVSYDPSKTNKDALSKKLASVGHDTEKYKAPDDVYSKLPACCHYERAK